jgi:quinol monooxygenase YgiN
MITIVWQYTINPEHRDSFLSYYNAAGEWVKIFRQAKGYIDTELLESTLSNESFMTIDRWTSEAAYDEFLKEHAVQYGELDRLCAECTIQEKFVGKYVTVDNP